jgi:RNA polymerase sigma-70 factor, ECF subfamily
VVIADAVARDEAGLLARIATGDPEDITLLYDRYGRRAYALAYHLLGDRGTAEDVVQTAFLTIWRRAGTYDATRGTVGLWLLTIVRRQSLDVLRGQRSRGGAALDIATIASLVGDYDTAATVERGLQGERVHAALATLPPGQRQVIDLAYFDGLSQSAIAVVIALPLGTVKGRLRLGLGKLRIALRLGDGVAEHPAR